MKINEIYEGALKCGIGVTIAIIVALCFVANGLCGMWLVDVCFTIWMITTGAVLILAIMCENQKEESEDEDDEP